MAIARLFTPKRMKKKTFQLLLHTNIYVYTSHKRSTKAIDIIFYLIEFYFLLKLAYTENSPRYLYFIIREKMFVLEYVPTPRRVLPMRFYFPYDSLNIYSIHGISDVRAFILSCEKRYELML